jgi:apolipoprotein D and lipocalin family protein
MPWEQGNCQQARYSLNDDGTLLVYNTQYNAKKDKVDGQTGTARCDGPACKVKFFWFAPEGDYRVLATDYKNYSIVYSCSDLFGLGRTENVWVLTREQSLTDEVNSIVKGHIQDKIPHYTPDNFYRTVQDASCKYLGQ